MSEISHIDDLAVSAVLNVNTIASSCGTSYGKGRDGHGRFPDAALLRGDLDQHLTCPGSFKTAPVRVQADSIRFNTLIFTALPSRHSSKEAPSHSDRHRHRHRHRYKHTHTLSQRLCALTDVWQLMNMKRDDVEDDNEHDMECWCAANAKGERCRTRYG